MSLVGKLSLLFYLVFIGALSACSAAQQAAGPIANDGAAVPVSMEGGVPAIDIESNPCLSPESCEDKAREKVADSPPRIDHNTVVPPDSPTELYQPPDSDTEAGPIVIPGKK